MLKNPLELYGILSKIVKGYPPTYEANEGRELICKRINTFAVLNNPDDVNSGNLGKDVRHKDKVFFFSRKWEDEGKNAGVIEFTYPLLGIVEQDINLQDALYNQRQDVYSFQLFVIDQILDVDSLPDHDKCCELRTEEEIRVELIELLKSALIELGGFIKATVTKNDFSTVSDWYHRDFLASQMGNSLIQSYEEEIELFSTVLDNQGISIFVQKNPFVDNSIGVFANLQIVMQNCHKVNVNYENI